MASGSSTSSSDGVRLSSRAALLVGVLVVIGAELVVRASYTAPGAFTGRVAQARAALHTDRVDLVLFGTCLAEESLDQALLSDALGPGVRLHVLAAAGSAPLDWYLALRDLDAAGSADALAVAFGPSDLAASQVSWQTQALDLADWTATREIVWSTCTTPGGRDAECVADLYLRRASRLYRNRAYLANRLWHVLGVRVDSMRVSDGRPGAEHEGATTPPLHWLRRFLEVARGRGREPMLLELPGNPEEPGDETRRQRAQVRGRVRSALRGMRARVVSPPAPSEGYVDDVHVNAEGRRALTEAVAPMLVDLGVLPTRPASR
ncbi:MAG: hypothetical protein RLZZ299_1756 [Pseudomonadota bacterium]|jgi:hypothetical protein